NGALLDMDFHVTGCRWRLIRPQKANARKCILYCNALHIGCFQHFIAIEQTGVNGATHDARRESSAFLIEPVDDREIVFRRLSAFLDTFINLPGRVECGYNAVSAVEAPAKGLAVQV